MSTEQSSWVGPSGNHLIETENVGIHIASV